VLLLAFSSATRLAADDCRLRNARDPSALRVVVVLAGENDPRVARRIAGLGANAIATLTPPRLETALAAETAGLGYLPRLSTREITGLPWDASKVESIRRMPSVAGFQYLDESVREGYESPETQARVYGILKSLFPDRLVIHATRLDPIATDPGYLANFYRPEFTDLVTPYFYPVGTTVLGTQRETDPWEERLRSLLEPLAAATPAGKPILPVLQAFQQTGYPVGGGLPRRQLDVYAELWPANRNIAAFWWGGPTIEPFLGISDLPALGRGVQELFGAAPSRPSPCVTAPRGPLEFAP
jgi:hypothetical protein